MMNKINLTISKLNPFEGHLFIPELFYDKQSLKLCFIYLIPFFIFLNKILHTIHNPQFIIINCSL